MDDAITLLLKVYARIGPEVTGHSATAPFPESQMAMIDRFIEGRCDSKERREIAEFLQAHPAWIRRVADRVRMEREEGAASGCLPTPADSRPAVASSGESD